MQTHDWDEFETELKSQLLMLPNSPRKDIHLELSKARADHMNTGRVVQDSLNEINKRLIENKASFVARQVTAVAMAQFLWVYESDYTLLIDEISSLLIINGHDLFNTFKREFASSYADVTIIDMDTKLKFLKAHNFDVLDRIKDRKLRNKLAHNDFLLNADGRLIIDNVEVFIMDKLTALLNFVADANNSIAKCYNEVTDELFRSNKK